jgi:hypothetical protein
MVSIWVLLYRQKEKISDSMFAEDLYLFISYLFWNWIDDVEKKSFQLFCCSYSELLRRYYEWVWRFFFLLVSSMKMSCDWKNWTQWNFLFSWKIRINLWKNMEIYLYSKFGLNNFKEFFKDSQKVFWVLCCFYKTYNQAVSHNILVGDSY